MGRLTVILVGELTVYSLGVSRCYDKRSGVELSIPINREYILGMHFGILPGQ